MAHTIAVVEDEPDLREAVAEYLAHFGYDVVTAANAAEFRRLAEGRTIHIAVMDVAMPGEDGVSLARWLRSRSMAGIVMATAAGRQEDRIKGLEAGADDYIVKPYELRELLARIKTVLRRLPPEAVLAAPKPAPAPGRRVKVGSLVYDIGARRLMTAEGHDVDLTPSEFELLATLVERAGRVVSRDHLLSASEAGETTDNARSVDIRVARLRRKIEPDPENPTVLRTVRGEGYQLVVEPT